MSKAVDPRLERIARSTAGGSCAWCGFLPIQGHHPACEVRTGKIYYVDPLKRADPRRLAECDQRISERRERLRLRSEAGILARKARERSAGKGDEWWTAAQFLQGLASRGFGHLSEKQWKKYYYLKHRLNDDRETTGGTDAVPGPGETLPEDSTESSVTQPLLWEDGDGAQAES